MTEGSDCPQQKAQFATRRAAVEAARAASRAYQGRLGAFRCALCDCYHIGNPRAQGSKARARR